MLRDFCTNARFIAALPFLVIAHLCEDYVARKDAELASALNRPEDES